MARMWAATALVVGLIAIRVFTPDSTAGADWMSGSPILIEASGARPTPQAAKAKHPLGVPRPAPQDPGPYAFLGLQPSGAPIAYDPCRPISYVVNTRTMPDAARALVAEAVAEMQDVTGLNFDYEGGTDEVVNGMRQPFQPDRYGDRWAPVLITWTDQGEFPDLAGGIAGLGGSVPVPTGFRGSAYVSGVVALDGPQLDDVIYSSYTGKLQARAIIVHELGHLVGLDHVEDQSQLMNAVGGTVDLQSGDLAGLVELGAGACVPKL